MLSTIIICFIVACLCPWAIRRFAFLSGWLACIPAGLFIYFASLISVTSKGLSIHSSIHWLPAMDIQLSFYLDGLSLLFALLITGIGTIIVLYSSAYLRHHLQLNRFYAYLFFFMGAMLGVVLASNLISLFIFWELTTLSSFLLISFDHQRIAARQAALQGLLITAGGGLALLLGFILIYLSTGHFEITQLLQAGSLRSSALYPLITIMVLIGAFTKSAQFPFHFWLPNAMEAPTPVSAYLHSATMVQAGVYLVARLTPVLGGSHLWFIALTLFGALTMLVAVALALQSRDIKRMLAYSTIMALGLLFFLLASGKMIMVDAAMLFFFAHALYKAGLFLAAGNIDHATGTRDITQLRGLAKCLPMTWLGIILCAASMAGLPPLLGFVSKELIYEAKLSLGADGSLLLLIALLTNIGFAAISLLMVIKPFFGKLNPMLPKKAHEQVWQQWLGILIIAAISLLFGLLPYHIDAKLITPAVSAITPIGTPRHSLSTFGGSSSAFMLSIFTLLAGCLVFAFYQKINATLSRVCCLFSIEALITNAGRLFSLLAYLTTRFIQHGHLPRYIATVLTFIMGSVAITLYLFPNWHIKHLIPWQVSWFDWLLVLVMLIASFSIAIQRAYLANITCLSVIGICSSLIFLIYGAPDVAITQILVDILTIVIVVLALYRLPSLPKMKYVPKIVLCRNAMIAITAGITITILLLATTSIPFDRHVSDYYATHAFPLAYGRNIVNVILVDFRSLDTLGEVLVIALTGIGVYGLLKTKIERNRL